MRIAYFTAGNVGVGHLVQGMAVGRGLARAGFAGTYQMFGPPLPFAAARRADYETVEIQDDPKLYDRHLAQTSELARKLREFRPDLLLADLFWAPLKWLLPVLRTEAWLLVRICPESWLVGLPEFRFDRSQYARVLGTEPLAHPAVDETIDPIVVANPDECRPPGDLRERLAFPADEELVAILHAGERGEVGELRARAATERPFVLDLFDPEALFPAAEWLPGADRVVAGAGYNAFWEARWLGYFDRASFVPFVRTIDDQALRVRELSRHVPRENGADTLARWILSA